MERNGNNSGKKVYSFVNLKKCLGNKGEYTAITFIGNVISPSELTAKSNGNSVLSFKSVINNKGQYMSKALGMEIPEKDGAVWVRVSAWNKTGERLNNYLNTVSSSTLVITGTVKASVNGQYTNVDITMDDFAVYRDVKNGEQPAPQNQASVQQQMPDGSQAQSMPQAPVQQPVQQSAPQYEYVAQQPVNNSPFPQGFVQDEAFVPIPDDFAEEDLPF